VTLLMYVLNDIETYGPKNQETPCAKADKASLALITCLRASVFP
jgi:hypothetical protein